MCANTASNTLCAADKTSNFGDVCVLGLGVTGQAVVNYFLKHPQLCQSLTVYGGDSTAQTLEFVKKLPADVATYLDRPSIAGSFDTTVVSPGISPLKPLYQSAQSCSKLLISEPELAWKISPERWIGVTGTNGKTTVTMLTAHLLNGAGITAHAVGNIGTPCIELVDQRQLGDYLVAELSSYQLHSTVDFKPEVAILLNITPDHLSWHGSHQNYIADKLKILANLDSSCTAIIDATLPDTRQAFIDARDSGIPAIPLGTRDGIADNMVDRCGALQAAFLNPDSNQLELITARRHYQLIKACELQIRGLHNISNALSAAAAALAVGANPEAVSLTLSNFQPLEHRFEPSGIVNGVSFINDSKATNTDAAIKAILSFTSPAPTTTPTPTTTPAPITTPTLPVSPAPSAQPTMPTPSVSPAPSTPPAPPPSASVLALFGGRDKGTILDDLAQACQGVCKYAICYGEAGERIEQALNTVAPTVLVKTFKQAFAKAVELAQSGDTVLLSPACSSFDEFTSFEARGQAFKALVKDWQQQNQSNQLKPATAPGTDAALVPKVDGHE